ncbi:hypothetical protein [Desulfobacterium sp. N47]|uniref:hypothetical protein n=1 Tax=Desulfobacterium sp. N47 TaxID=3115210 RepID=UPI003C8B33B1
MLQQIKNRGWIVTFSGTCINLALGILYTWSIFKGSIEKSIKAGGEGAFNWDLASLNDPYAICCLVFSFAMILAGKCRTGLAPELRPSWVESWWALALSGFQRPQVM